MSTNKTQNYNLHAWEPNDDFLRQEINENFAALDTAVGSKAEIVVGFYIGNGASFRTIALGRKPLAVLVELSAPTYQKRGFAIQGHSFYGDILKLTDTGFTVVHEDIHSTNNDRSKYLYLAVVE